MSDGYNPFVDEGIDTSEIDPSGATGDDGQLTEELQQEAPERSYLDLDDDVAGKYVKIKVDGEDVEVPLGEALSGYSRQADYTRKTQELAQQRQQLEAASLLQRALQAQPGETLRLLARQYNVQFEQPQGQPQRGTPPPENPYLDEYEDYGQDDPMARRLTALEQRLQQNALAEERREADRVLHAAIGGLQQRYQVDEATTREVVTRALQRRVGPEMFDTIYKEIAFDRAQAARQQSEAARAAETQRREAAKSQASALMGSGGGTANGFAAGAIPPDPDRRMTLEEAFAAAEAELGSPFS